MTFERLTPDAALSQLDGPQPVWIFKHSLTCSISARALTEVDAFAGRNPGVRVVLIAVQRERALSRAVAERFGVPHASPQVILVVDGVAVWTASHFGVSMKALEQSLARLDGLSPSRRPA
ncbi:MAG: bacillithiol system redox-active protein YtxJ [Gemmatimonadota bacterium]|nr:bacillithiol system redox-active protein YtxJ [Gemmatimonadota bacterium]